MLRAGVQTVKVAGPGHGSGIARPGAVALLPVVVALALGTGCFSTRYPGLMERHLEVMSLYARKLESLALDERTVAPQDWGEFTYPLKRARDFAAIAATHYPERASLRAFQTTLDRYASLVAEPRILAGPDAARVVQEQVAAFLAAVASTREALHRESGE